MNREILFRGKRTDNGEWVYGSYNRIVGTTEMMVKFDVSDKREHEFKMVELNIHLITQNYLPDTQGWDYNGCFRHHNVAPESVGQFTGLTDKGGVKIFEGDVLSIEIVDEDSVLGSSDFYTGAVIYGRDYKSTNKGKVTSYPCSFTIHCNDWYMEEGLLGMNNHDVEIIGNIHDNPELIK